MNCMKCGREIDEGQVFCSSCLEDMANYPVKPGIAIQLPSRKDTAVQRKSHFRRRQPPTQEDQILKLKKRLKRVIILWFITLLLLAATTYPTIRYFTGNHFLRPGQNYKAITSTDTTIP